MLIILATVSINLIFNEGGIIKKAQEAKEMQANATKYEEEQLGNLEEEMMSKIPAGTEVTKPTTWTSSQVRAITDGLGNIVPLPKEFVYVGGNINEGLVISDNKADENKGTSHEVASTLAGNQFVWIPVDGTTIKYEQDKTYNGADDREWFYYHDETDKTIIYDDWADEGENSESVATYGGFYIARYEAGIPSSAEFYPTNNNMEYADSSKKDTTSVIPVSKKGIAWSYISQISAEEVSKNMYKDSASVTSSLVDSYAWDTVCNYISKDESDKDTYLRNSTEYGNYYDSTRTIQNTIYAIHTNSSKWTIPQEYVKGNVTQPNKSGESRIEIETGAIAEYSTKNIYDLSGNMCEWTREKGKHGSTSDTATTYAVLRGGSFANYGYFNSVVSRHGGYWVDYTHPMIGFRVVLYIK